METWIGRSAEQIAAAVRAGEVEPRLVVQQHLDRIERLNPQLNAFRRIRREEALAEVDALAVRSDLAELPLAGVPLAVKDNVPVSGEQSRIGSAATSTSAMDADHQAIARLRAAGAIVVGLTNVPELCLLGMTDSVYGITRNPWDRGRTAGGSSGGSAAAVAAALVPIAHGNDGLGSIRIPASACGLVGIKPGTGVVPAEKEEGGEPPWFGLVENGVLATTARDAAIAMAVMANAGDLAEPQEPRSVRVGVSTKPLQLGVPIDRSIIAATVGIGDLLAEQGHTVSRHTANYPAWLGAGIALTWFACAREDARELERSQLDKSTRGFVNIGRALEPTHLTGARTRTRWRAEAAGKFFGDIDVLVLPTLTAPPPFARRYGERSALRNVTTNTKFASLLGPWNVAGWPAMNVPAGVHDVGTPIGVQLVARPGGERLLLALAAQLESARPWPRHAPEYRP